MYCSFTQSCAIVYGATQDYSVLLFYSKKKVDWLKNTSCDSRFSVAIGCFLTLLSGTED
jgi:hypothetical protein